MFADMEAFDVEMEELDALLKSDEFNSDVPEIVAELPSPCWGCGFRPVSDPLALCTPCEEEYAELDRIDAEEHSIFMAESSDADDSLYVSDDDGTLDFLEGYHDEY